MARRRGVAAGVVAALGAAVLVAEPWASGRAQEIKTLKERLSDKASDEQRIDNCGVPPERRGTVPTGCPGEESASDASSRRPADSSSATSPP